MRWRSIQEKSSNWMIFSGMMTVAGLSLLVSVAAAGKELLLAHRFGTRDEMDAFLIAFLLPTIAKNIAAGSFQTAFIPEFVKLREAEGEGSAKLFLTQVIGGYFLFLVFFSLLLIVLSPLLLPLIGVNLNSETLALSQSLFYILIPTIVLSGLIKAWESVLHAGGHFILTSISPVTMHIVSVLMLLWVGRLWGIRALAVGVLTGFLVEGLLLIWALKSRGYRLLPRWEGFNDSTRRFIQQFVPMILGSFLMCGTSFVDQSMAAMEGVGGVSALGYGHRIVQTFLGIGTLAMSTVTLPYFSKMVVLGKWRDIRHTVKVYTRLILWVSVPITLFFIYFSEPIIRIVFERGAFDVSDTVWIGKIQSLFFLQMPFYLVGILGVRLLSALGQNKIVMILGGVNLLTNIIGNYILMPYWGVAGIALSTSIVYLISSIMIFVALSRLLKARERRH